MSATAKARVGTRTELGRYRTATEERVIYGQRINGVVRISDVRASGGGRSYLIERGLEDDGHAALTALVADYLGCAARLGAIPMAELNDESGHGRWLCHFAPDQE